MSPTPVLRWLRMGRCTLLMLVAVVGIAGCGTIAGALPPQPSPFPTFARLPSVTPVQPSPTPDLTALPRATPTPAILAGTAAVGANVRDGPGVTFTIIGSVVAGGQVILRGQRDGWYQVVTADGTEGWMAAEVLDVPARALTTLPTITP